jgi:hypothetical protein
MHIVDDEEDLSSNRSGILARTEASVLPLGVQARIGAELRNMYAELKDQPLPDRLLQLAQQLEQKCQERVRGH